MNRDLTMFDVFVVAFVATLVAVAVAVATAPWRPR